MKKISLGTAENNVIEQVTDFYHIVNFIMGNNPANPQTSFVRIRGLADPKVVVDPFLDSYGARAADYAGSPSDKAAISQVITSPLANFHDANRGSPKCWKTAVTASLITKPRSAQ